MLNKSSIPAKISNRVLALSCVTATTLLGALSAASCGANTPTQSAVQDFTGTQLDGYSLPYKTLSLTFDDGPGTRTAELGSYLEAQNIKATFFVVGRNIPGNESVLAQLQRQGHLIANHSYNHDAMTTVSSPVGEVANTDNLIKPYVTGNMFLFRAPYGDWSSSVSSILNANGLKKYVGSVFWDIGGERNNVHSADWDCWSKNDSISACELGYLNEIDTRGKGVVLFHDNTDNNRTIDMVKSMVPKLKARGYKFVRLDAVPEIAAGLRKAGGTPGSNDGSTPVVVGQIACPAGYTLAKVGTAGGALCTNATDAWGPFTNAMTQKCFSFSGGSACNSDRWAVKMATSLRGDGLCPVGSSYDADTTYCAEGNNAFGPFPASIIAKCIAQGGGDTACKSARYNRAFLAGLVR